MKKLTARKVDQMLADYESGMSSTDVARKHKVSSATAHRYIHKAGISRSLSKAKNVERSRRREAEYALTGGRWVNVRGVMRWEPDKTPKPVARKEPIACPCGARLSEPCRTAGGNPTKHVGRLTSRRCPCGNPPRAKSLFCTEECRLEARARTYAAREVRTPTRERRAA